MELRAFSAFPRRFSACNNCASRAHLRWRGFFRALWHSWQSLALQSLSITASASHHRASFFCFFLFLFFFLVFFFSDRFLSFFTDCFCSCSSLSSQVMPFARFSYMPGHYLAISVSSPYLLLLHLFPCFSFFLGSCLALSWGALSYLLQRIGLLFRLGL